MLIRTELAIIRDLRQYFWHLAIFDFLLLRASVLWGINTFCEVYERAIKRLNHTKGSSLIASSAFQKRPTGPYLQVCTV